MRRSDFYAGLPAGTEAVAVESGHGGGTMEKETSKEPYITPEIEVVEMETVTLASCGSPGCGCGSILP
jgi:hypothetical protein